MNEEISRILQLLEEHTITAGEAERLLLALHQADDGRPSAAPASRADTGHDNQAPAAVRALRAFAQAQRRQFMWQLYRFHQTHAEARSWRSRVMDPLGRVRFVLEHRVFVGTVGLDPSSRLREDLRLDAMALDVLRMALEIEFGMNLEPSALADLTTVQEVADRMASEESKAAAQSAAPGT
jgi:acyl carrier protein